MSTNAAKKGINININGRDFSVACPPEEQERLLEASRYLDEKMREIQKSGKIIGTERCAIMAALNITNELLELQKSTEGQRYTQSRLMALQEKINSALDEV